jgi:hypothetical protein
VSFAAITLCVASQRGFIAVSIYFVTDSVWKLLDKPLYVSGNWKHEGPVVYLHFTFLYS